MTLSATGDATRRGRATTFRLASADAKALRTAGALRLRAKGRSVTLRSPRLELGSNPRVTALVGGRRSTLLTLAVAPVRTDSGVQLERTGATLTASAAKAIARRLNRDAAAPVVRDGLRGRQLQRATTPGGPRRPADRPPAPAARPRPRAAPAGARRAAGQAATRHRADRHRRDDHLAGARVVHPLHGRRRGDDRLARRRRRSSRGAGRGAPARLLLPLPVRRGLVRPRDRVGPDRVHRHRRVPLRRPRDRPGRQRPGGRARRPGLAGDLPPDRDGRHRGRQSARRRRDARRLEVGRGGHRAHRRLRADPRRVPPGAASSVFAGYHLPGDPFGWVSISFTTA